jgi:hypothetical protein
LIRDNTMNGYSVVANLMRENLMNGYSVVANLMRYNPMNEYSVVANLNLKPAAFFHKIFRIFHTLQVNSWTVGQ